MFKKLNQKFNDLATAVAFAECGEWDQARAFLGDYEAAAGSDNRKFVVVFQNRLIAPSLLNYAATLSRRLCYDLILLHSLQRGRKSSALGASLERAKSFFTERYQKVVADATAAGLGVHYLVSDQAADDALAEVYRGIGHVEFAIVESGVSFDRDGGIGLSLFFFRAE